MTKIALFLCLSAAITGWSSSDVFAQNPSGDVCCVLAQVTGDTVDTQATVRGVAECKSGAADGDHKVCSGFKDEANTCPELAKKNQCQMCGYIWIGGVCMKEDPVKKAKEELKKEKLEKKSPESPKPSGE